jgi:hypothetical protein
LPAFQCPGYLVDVFVHTHTNAKKVGFSPQGLQIYRVVGVADLISTYPRVYFVFFKKFLKKKIKYHDNPYNPVRGAVTY